MLINGLEGQFAPFSTHTPDTVSPSISAEIPPREQCLNSTLSIRTKVIALPLLHIYLTFAKYITFQKKENEHNNTFNNVILAA